jgi:hypothetical protein
MWEIDNRTEFAALGYFVRDRIGAEHWVTAVRARFQILPSGLCRLHEEQGEIRVSPEYVDKETTEFLIDSDLCPFRPQTDFILHGKITAPEGSSRNKVDVGFNLAGKTKNATAFGRRMLRMVKGKLELDGYEPFGQCDLSWRNSLGGRDFLQGKSEVCGDNPIGMGWSERWQDLPAGTEVSLPLIENPDHFITDGPLPRAVGFGAVHPAWQVRAKHAGTYDEDWRKYEAPLLPADFSDRFYQTAPEDQVFELKGGDDCHIFGLTESGPYSFRLPQVILETATWMGGNRFETRPRLISVAVNGSDKTLEMVWNSAIRCPIGDMAVSNSRAYVRQMAGVER